MNEKHNSTHGATPSDGPSLTDEDRAVIAAGGSVFKNCYVENAIPALGVKTPDGGQQ